MKKLGLLPVSLILFSGAVHAGILLDEDFGYADGSLTTVGSATWSTHSGTSGQIQVTAGSIQVSDSSSEDVNASIGSAITTGSVFASFDFSVTSSGGGGTDFEYFAHFGTGSSTFNSRMDLQAPGAGGDFTVGIGHSSTADAAWATDLSFSTTYKAVIGFNRDTGIASLWINPVDIASTSITSTGTSSVNVDAFYFRQSSSSMNETITIDNLVVGTTFADVVPVPEPGTIAFIFGAIAFGFVAWRRRK